MSENIDELKDEEKEKLDAAEKRQSTRHTAAPSHPERKNAWIPGAILIGLGLIFLVSNVTGFYFHNWWALFILIPGIVNFSNAWNAYREDGRFSKRARGSLIGGTIITFIAVIFLFNLDWARIWPVFLILVGFNILLGGWLDG